MRAETVFLKGWRLGIGSVVLRKLSLHMPTNERVPILPITQSGVDLMPFMIEIGPRLYLVLVQVNTELLIELDLELGFQRPVGNEAGKETMVDEIVELAIEKFDKFWDHGTNREAYVEKETEQ